MSTQRLLLQLLLGAAYGHPARPSPGPLLVILEGGLLQCATLHCIAQHCSASHITVPVDNLWSIGMSYVRSLGVQGREQHEE